MSETALISVTSLNAGDVKISIEYGNLNKSTIAKISKNNPNTRLVGTGITEIVSIAAELRAQGKLILLSLTDGDEMLLVERGGEFDLSSMRCKQQVIHNLVKMIDDALAALKNNAKSLSTYVLSPGLSGVKLKIQGMVTYEEGVTKHRYDRRNLDYIIVPEVDTPRNHTTVIKLLNKHIGYGANTKVLMLRSDNALIDVTSDYLIEE